MPGRKPDTGTTTKILTWIAEGKTTGEVANMLGIKEQSVKDRLIRAGVVKRKHRYKEVQDCPVANLRNAKGLSANHISRHLGMSLEKVVTRLKAMPEYQHEHSQLAIVDGGYAMSCAGCWAVGPVTFVTLRAAEIGDGRGTEARALPWGEDGMRWVEIPVPDEAGAFEQAEGEGWRCYAGEMFCPQCMGRIAEIMRERELEEEVG